MKDRTQLLGESPVGSLLLKFSVPAIIAMIAIALYNVVDSIFVGRGVGSLALTAVTIAFPIMIIMMAFGMLIGIGATALISIRLGQNRKEEAEQILGNAFAMILVLGVALPAVTLAFLDPILIYLGATPDVLGYARDFTIIIMLGTIFQLISFGLNNVIRAEGNPMISMGTMLFSAVMNTILNPIFIFTFDMGIRGSALATVLTQVLVSAYILYHFTKGKGNLKLRRRNIRLERPIIAQVSAIGLSPFLLQVAASFTSFLYNTELLLHGGEMAVAAMGVISRTTMMILMPIFGINQGSQPIIGYNYGAKKYDRVKRALMLASAAATVICLIGFALTQIFSSQIISIFNNDAQLISIGSRGLRIYLAMLAVLGVQIVITNYFQAVGKPKQAILLSLVRQVMFQVPLILILPRFFGLTGIWVAGPISDFAAAVVAVVMLRRELSHLDDKHEERLEDSLAGSKEVQV